MYIKRYAPLALEELVANIGLSSIEVHQKGNFKKQKIFDLIHKDQIIEEEGEEGNKEEDEDE